MVAYAVGEMSRLVPAARDSEEESISDNQQPSRSRVARSISRGQPSTVARHRKQKPVSCYEVVTAWVHPR